MIIQLWALGVALGISTSSKIETRLDAYMSTECSGLLRYSHPIPHKLTHTYDYTLYRGV